MAGIFPTAGVVHGAVGNTVDVNTTCEGNELFYGQTTCQPRFDPLAMNALISEILNLATCAGGTYDCSSLSNLCDAMPDIIRNTVLGMVANSELLSSDANNTLTLGSDDLLYQGTTAAEGFAMDIVPPLGTGPDIVISHETDELLHVDAALAPSFINGMQWLTGDTLVAEKRGWYMVTILYGANDAVAQTSSITNKYGQASINGGASFEVWRSGSIGGEPNVEYGPGSGYSYPVLLQPGDTLRNYANHRHRGGTGTSTVKVIRISAVLVQDLGQ